MLGREITFERLQDVLSLFCIDSELIDVYTNMHNNKCFCLLNTKRVRY